MAAWLLNVITLPPTTKRGFCGRQPRSVSGAMRSGPGKQFEKEEAARAKLNGKRTWTLTDDPKVVRCDLLIADPPFGITDEPWEPEDVEGFNRDWARRWAACGADFVAIFWCEQKLLEGRKWFDESLKGYEFQQMLVWHANNGSGPRTEADPEKLLVSDLPLPEERFDPPGGHEGSALGHHARGSIATWLPSHSLLIGERTYDSTRARSRYP